MCLIIFLVAAVAFLSLIFWIVIQDSDWARLAERYRARGVPQGVWLTCQSIAVGDVSCGLTSICVSEQGLYIASALPFPGFAPLLIPWSDIHNAGKYKRLWQRRVYFDVGSPAITTIEMKAEIVEKWLKI